MSIDVERLVDIIEMDDQRQRRHLRRYGTPRLTREEMRTAIGKEKMAAAVALDDAWVRLANGRGPQPEMRPSLYSIGLLDCELADEDGQPWEHHHDGWDVRFALPDGSQMDLPAAYPRPSLYVCAVVFDQPGAWVAQFHGGDECAHIGPQVPIMAGPRDDRSEY